MKNLDSTPDENVEFRSKFEGPTEKLTRQKIKSHEFCSGLIFEDTKEKKEMELFHPPFHDITL